MVSTEKDGFTTRTISTFHTLSILGSPVMMDGTDDKNKMQLLSLLNAKWGLNEHLIAFVEKSQAAEIQELYRSVVGEDALQTLIPLVYVIGESNDAAKMAKSYGAVLNKELATATGGSSGLQPNLPIFGIANYTQVFTRHRLHHDPSQVNGVCFKDGKEVTSTPLFACRVADPKTDCISILLKRCSTGRPNNWPHERSPARFYEELL